MPAVSFSGLASGIDGDAVIKAILDSRRSVTLPLKAQVEDAAAETTALEDLNTKLLSMRSLLDGFLTLSGGAISKKASSSNEDAVTATASTSAFSSGTTVSVTSLARAATFSFNDRFTSAETPLAPTLAAPTDLKFTIGNGTEAKEVSISITNTTTLSELAAKINEAAPGKLQASAVNIGTTAAPQFLLLIGGLETGLEKGELSVAVPPELTGAGLFAASTLEQAKNSVFTLSGIGEVTRQSNTVGDLIPGVTLQLKQENTGPVTISVTNDGQKTAENFQKFVDALNTMITDVQGKDKIERVENGENATNTFGPLARTRVDNSVIQELRQAIGDSQSGVPGSAVQILADLGVTIKRDGTYAFDGEKFAQAVNKDPAAANRLISSFADKVATTKGIISNYTGFQGQIDTALKSNESETKSINERLDALERSFQEQEDSMKRTFANLESTISRLNSQSNALSSILAGATSARR